MKKTDRTISEKNDKGRMWLILLLFVSAGLHAQFYEYGQDAGRLKWFQFRTPHYRFIFPEGVDSTARDFATKLEYFYPYTGGPLDHRHRTQPVIIHNESSFSNGVYVYAPRRLEIFTNPDPNGYPQDWLAQLALHEGRHAVQIDKMDQGFTKALSFIGGEQALGAMLVFLPYWYLEGDAVDAETRLSNTGRGRQPSFEKELKAQMLEKGQLFSFSKATMGSYRDYVPNHYKLGYLMVRYGRMAYGNGLWIDFQENAARKPYLLNPTFFSMRKYGIRSKNQFYKDALSAFGAHWEEGAQERTYSPSVPVNLDRDRHYTSYTFPHEVTPTSVVAYKSGINQIPGFIFIDEDGKERRIFRPGILSSGRVSFSSGVIVWDEFVPDTRWSNRNYSVIRTYDLATGKVNSLGRRTRYYAPVASKDGSKVAAVEQTVSQHFNLVILGMDGELISSTPSPANRFIQHPAWMEGDSALVVLLSDETGKSLYSYGTADGNWEKLMEIGFDDISFPVVKDNRIFFSGTFSGIDNIYCMELPRRIVYQVTSSRFGAFHPQLSEDGSELLYSNYTADGYDVVSLPVDQGTWKPLEEVRDHSDQLNYERTGAESRIIDEALHAEKVDFNPRKYSKALHLFNIHSWLPLYVDYLNPSLTLNPEQMPFSPGVSLISQNLLSTAVSQIGYEYKNGYHLFHSGIKLNGRYPVMNLFFDYGGEAEVIKMAEGDSIVSTPRDLRLTAQTYVPFRLNTGKFLTIIRPRIDYSYSRDVQFYEGTGRYRRGAHYLYYNLYASSYLRKGIRDILPRVGLTAFAGYYHAPFNNQVFGSAAYASAVAYLPGILKHQTLRLTFGYQRQYPLDMAHPAFINLMGNPRGLHGIFGEILTKYGADLVFPILSPDLSIGPILYVQRIRGAIWGDYMMGTNVIITEPNAHYEDRNYLTVGVDLTADLNALRIPFPFSVGGRVSYEPETGDIGISLLYTLDFN